MSVKPPTLTVRLIRPSETLPLRHRVLRPQQPPEELVFPGDDAEDTAHLGGFIDAPVGERMEPVAIASLYREPPPGEGARDAWRLRGMAVDAAIQGRGYGGVLLDACVAHVRSRGGRFLWCNARTHACGFYLSRGFVLDGGEFDIPGVGPHYQMRLLLK